MRHPRPSGVSPGAAPRLGSAQETLLTQTGKWLAQSGSHSPPGHWLFNGNQKDGWRTVEPAVTGDTGEEGVDGGGWKVINTP